MNNSFLSAEVVFLCKMVKKYLGVVRGVVVPFNPFKPRGFFYFNSLDMFISYIRGV